MFSLDAELKRPYIEILLQTGLIVIATILFSYHVSLLPLVDSDEAIYAQVTVDSLNSGNVLSFNRGSENWFEKPPLYLWLTMGAVKLLGEGELAFRLPSIIFSIAALWLVYLITKEISSSPITASLAFLILLSSPAFYVFGIEARMDSGVIAAILATLFLLLKGWKQGAFLFGIFPALAIGFMIKSVIIGLAFPVVILYSLFYRRWEWLRSMYLWIGLLPALVIVVPWHILQSLRFGVDFWNSYLVYHIFRRTISTLTGSSNYYDYVLIIWSYSGPWIWALIVSEMYLLLAVFLKKIRPHIPWKDILTPLSISILILLLFTLARTHLSPYILPVFPFLSIFLALLLNYLSSFLHAYAQHVLVVFMLALSVFGVFKDLAAKEELVQPYIYEERNVGQAYRILEKTRQAPLYALDWLNLDTVSYYAATTTQYLDPLLQGGEEIRSPFYMITNTLAMRHFVDAKGNLLPEYANVKGWYVGKFLILLYSDAPIRLPVFNTRYVNY